MMLVPLLMVASTDDIHMLLLEYLSGIVALRTGRIVEAISFYSIASIDQKKIVPISFYLLTQSMCERIVVTPISAEGGPWKTALVLVARLWRVSGHTLVDGPRASHGYLWYEGS